MVIKQPCRANHWIACLTERVKNAGPPTASDHLFVAPVKRLGCQYCDRKEPTKGDMHVAATVAGG